MPRGRRIYDEEGSLKSGQLRDFDEARRLRASEQKAQDFQNFLNDPTAHPGRDDERQRLLDDMDKKSEEIDQLLKERGFQTDSKKTEPDEDSSKKQGWFKKKGKDDRKAEDLNDKELRKRRWRKRGLAGGGALGGVGLIGGLGLFSMTLGPLQFAHISQVLSGYGFGSQEQADNDRVMRLMRFVRFASQGQTERTRLGFLGNKLADRYEARLNSIGLKSGYSAAFGFFDGYVIDRSYPEYRGMNDQQLINHIEEKDGVKVRRGAEFPGNAGFNSQTMVISGKDMGYRGTRKFATNKLKDAGLYNIATGLAARVLQKRGGGSSLFHPIKKLDEKILRKVDEVYVKWKQRQVESLRAQNSTNITTNIASRDDADPEERANAAGNQAEADNILEEGERANNAVAEGRENALSGFRNTLSFKIAAGGAAASGILAIPCLLNSIAEHADEVKQNEVINPLKRIGIQWVALGQQVMAGVDLSAEQLKPFNDQLTDVDSQGRKTSFFDSDIWRTVTGDTARGNPPDSTIQTLGKGTPFDDLKKEPSRSVLAVACSSVVTAAGLVLSFITGPVSTLVSTVVGIVALPHVLDAAAGWLSGNAVNIFAKGAKAGDNAMAGITLAGNDLELASGGSPMTKEEEQKAREVYDFAQAEEFQSKSLAYRLFNPHDYRTPVAKLIDQQSTSDFMANMASAFGALLNVGNTFGGTLFGAISGQSHAVPQQYPWSFPKIGFSPDLMNDTRFANPYDNATKAAGILDGPTGQIMIDRAKRCNGVTISKTDNQWNATSDANSSPYITNQNLPECNDRELPWLRIRFFIKDTVAANTMACYEGEAQACIDSGFNAPTNDVGNVNPIDGNAKSLAQQIIDSGRVTWQLTEQETAFRQIAETGAQVANGDGCTGQTVPVNPNLLSVILQLVQTKGYKLVLGTLVHGHDCDNGEHPKGNAVDINGVEKDGVTTGRQLHIYQLNAQQATMVKEFYSAIADVMPPGMGAIGQIQCWGNNPPPQRQPIKYFTDDNCEHLHIDVRKL